MVCVAIWERVDFGTGSRDSTLPPGIWHFCNLCVDELLRHWLSRKLASWWFGRRVVICSFQMNFHWPKLTQFAPTISRLIIPVPNFVFRAVFSQDWYKQIKLATIKCLSPVEFRSPWPWPYPMKLYYSGIRLLIQSMSIIWLSLQSLIMQWLSGIDFEAGIILPFERWLGWFDLPLNTRNEWERQSWQYLTLIFFFAIFASYIG